MTGVLGKWRLVPRLLAFDVVVIIILLQFALASSNLAMQLGVGVGEPHAEAEATDLLGLSNDSGAGDADGPYCGSILGLERPRSRGKLRCGGQHGRWHGMRTMLRCSVGGSRRVLQVLD